MITPWIASIRLIATTSPTPVRTRRTAVDAGRRMPPPTGRFRARGSASGASRQEMIPVAAHAQTAGAGAYSAAMPPLAPSRIASARPPWRALSAPPVAPLTSGAERRTDPVVIAGGGIGGLAAALGLHRARASSCRVLRGRAGAPPARRRHQPAAARGARAGRARPARPVADGGVETGELVYVNRTASGSGASRAVSPPATTGRSTRSTAAALQLLLLRGRARAARAPTPSSTGQRCRVRASGATRRGRRGRPAAAVERTVERATCWSAPTASTPPSAAQLYPDEGAPKWNGRMLWRGDHRAPRRS